MICPECFPPTAPLFKDCTPPAAPSVLVDGVKVPEKAANKLVAIGILFGILTIVAIAAAAARPRRKLTLHLTEEQLDELLEEQKPE